MTDIQIITLVISLVVLITGGSYLLITYKKNKKAQIKTSQLDASKLLEALGGANNIVNTTLENKRLKLSLDNPKLVSQTLLKSMDISGFLTGKELKLLIKDNPVEVKNNLDKIRNEVTK